MHRIVLMSPMAESLGGQATDLDPVGKGGGTLRPGTNNASRVLGARHIRSGLTVTS